MHALRRCGPAGGLRCAGEFAADRAASAARVFVCAERPAVVHFMSGTYNTHDAGYYAGFWRAYDRLELPLIADALRADAAQGQRARARARRNPGSD